LIELARRPDAEVLLARVRERKHRVGSRLSVETILGHRDADRR
jgi:antitoxin FitA